MLVDFTSLWTMGGTLPLCRYSNPVTINCCYLCQLFILDFKNQNSKDIFVSSPCAASIAISSLFSQVRTCPPLFPVPNFTLFLLYEPHQMGNSLIENVYLIYSPLNLHWPCTDKSKPSFHHHHSNPQVPPNFYGELLKEIQPKKHKND